MAMAASSQPVHCKFVYQAGSPSSITTGHHGLEVDFPDIDSANGWNHQAVNHQSIN